MTKVGAARHYSLRREPLSSRTMMTHHPRPPDWQLPPGVTPGLWEYLHDEELARLYLEKVKDSPFASADERFVTEQLPVPCRVVDLGCGPGRSLVPLAERGFQCVGVDLSKAMLHQAQKEFLSRRLSADWVNANLCERLPLEDGRFDAALCLFGTLGMLHPASMRKALLLEVKRILKPKGTFLVHVHNKWSLFRWRRLFPGKPGTEPGVVTMPVHQGIANLQMKLFSLSEITGLLNEIGFSSKAVRHLWARPTPENRRPWFLPGLRASGFLIACSSSIR